MNRRALAAIGASTLAAITAVLVIATRTNDADQELRAVDRIAHAGGGFNSATYTNSLDALDANAPNFALFEIDFSFTSDGALVCMHDWKGNAQSTFGRQFDSPPTLGEFEHLVAQSSRFKTCTLDTLVEWMKAHPDKRIVTDVKENNLKALELIARRVPDHATRVIPQIYQPREYQPVRDLGYRDIIWTLYRYGASAEQIVERAGDMSLYAITMPKERAATGLGRILADELRLPSYVHTINDEAERTHFRSLGISEIYTDWLIDARMATPQQKATSSNE